MPRLLIQYGRIIDPSQDLDRVANLLIEDGTIVAYDAYPQGDETIIDAQGRIVAPGLIDMHAQLREPGREEDETIFTGTAAALAGGFTTIACLPNTEPPLDTAAGVEFVHQKAARANHCRVAVIACVSKGREGEQLAEIGSLVEAGAVAFSDAERPIANPELLRRALQYCLMFDKPILNRPETTDLSHGGVMHEGRVSLVLGLSGLSADAEDVMTARDLRLADITGGRLHLMSISSAASVELIRRAKSRGKRVTAEVCPPHFTLTDEALRTFDANFKVNPPLRSQEHVEACIAGLKDGTIDVIASGHAPRASEKKMQELDQAPFGMSSLETVLPLVVTQLIEPGHLDWMSALAKLTIHPAAILGLKAGTLQVGAAADVTIIDPQAEWTVEPRAFRSQSSNTAFAGWKVRGRATHTIVGGEVKFAAEKQTP